MIVGGHAGRGWYWGEMRHSTKNDEEFYETWQNKNSWFHTNCHCIFYTFIFLPWMNEMLWLISHYFTCCNLKRRITENLPIESTRIQFLSWLFFRVLKVEEDRDDRYWSQFCWLVLTFSQPSHTMKGSLRERDWRGFFIKCTKWTCINSSFKATKRKSYKLMIPNLSSPLKSSGVYLLTTKRLDITYFCGFLYPLKMK